MADLDIPTDPPVRRKTVEEKVDAHRSREFAVLLAELAGWLSVVLAKPQLAGDADIFSVKSQQLFDHLGNGVLLCQLLTAIDKSFSVGPIDTREGLAYSRDNVTNFLAGLTHFEIPKVCYFETTDLTARKNERSVVNCLLYLARVACVKFGIKPPTIVQFELDIEGQDSTDTDFGEINARVEELIAGNDLENVERVGKGLYVLTKATGARQKVHVRIVRDQLLARANKQWVDFEEFACHASGKKVQRRTDLANGEIDFASWTIHRLAKGAPDRSQPGRFKELYEQVKQRLESDPNLDVNAPNSHGHTPAHIAAAQGHFRVLDLLLEKGGTTESDDGVTPLHVSSKRGHIQCMRLLVDRGADINAVSSTGETPLMYAVQEGRTEAVEYLLWLGAKIDTKSESGTALDMARQLKEKHFDRDIDKERIQKYLQLWTSDIEVTEASYNKESKAGFYLLDAGQWTARERYSNLRRMYEALCTKYGKSTVPSFPGKSWWIFTSHKADKFLEQRRKGIDGFFKELFSTSGIAKTSSAVWEVAGIVRTHISVELKEISPIESSVAQANQSET